jgi:hemerythrin-like metal-binding protein
MAAFGSNSLSTGVREIDADTEGLCFLMARIFDPLVECQRRHGSCDQSHCTRIDAILRYMGRSFDRQEKLMAEADYPADLEHRRDHQEVKEQLRAMQAARLCADRDRHVLRETVMRWVVGHNAHCDLPLGSWAVTRRVLPPAGL